MTRATDALLVVICLAFAAVVLVEVPSWQTGGAQRDAAMDSLVALAASDASNGTSSSKRTSSAPPSPSRAPPRRKSSREASSPTSNDATTKAATTTTLASPIVPAGPRVRRLLFPGETARADRKLIAFLAAPPPPAASSSVAAAAAPEDDILGSSAEPPLLSPPPQQQKPRKFQPAPDAAELRRLLGLTGEASASDTSRLLAEYRYLSTYQIDQRYGLTNVLMSYASMILYAAMSRRVVIDPEFEASRTPVAMEKLLDLPATERALSRFLNMSIVLLTAAEGKIATKAVAAIAAKKAGVSLGNRAKSNSNQADLNAAAFVRIVGVQHQLVGKRFVVHRSFFESFAFRSVAPLDPCLVSALLIPSVPIRTAAGKMATKLQTMLPSPGSKWAAVHLRVEADAKLVRAEIKTDEDTVVAWWNAEILPLMRALSVSLIYIAAGSSYSDDLHKRLQQETKQRLPSVVAVLRKQAAGAQMGGVNAQMNSKTHVTSHTAAFVDTLLLARADVAVSFRQSTLPIAVLRRRCRDAPDEADGRFGPVSARTQSLLRSPWCGGGTGGGDSHRLRYPAAQPAPCDIEDVKQLVESRSKVGALTEKLRRTEEGLVEEPTRAARGIFLYDLGQDGSFTRLAYASCAEKDFLGQCNRDLRV